MKERNLRLFCLYGRGEEYKILCCFVLHLLHAESEESVWRNHFVLISSGFASVFKK